MSWDDVGTMHGEVALTDMEVGAAHSAGQDPNLDLSGPRLRHRDVHQFKRIFSDRGRMLYSPCSHASNLRCLRGRCLCAFVRNDVEVSATGLSMKVPTG
jgi:hypothetical protein